jgi:hypothetical protein
MDVTNMSDDDRDDVTARLEVHDIDNLTAMSDDDRDVALDVHDGGDGI